MKKTLIVCAGGMLSSLVAKKATALFQTQGTDIEVLQPPSMPDKRQLKTINLICTWSARKRGCILIT